MTALAAALLAAGCTATTDEVSGTDAGGNADSNAGGGAASDAGLVSGPIGEWVWYDIPGAACANGTQTGIGANRGTGSAVVVYLSGGGACLDEGCTIGTPSMRKDGGFGAAELEACVAGSCDGSVTFPSASIFDRTAPGNPFTDATYVFISNCSGDYYVGDGDHAFPGWTAHFRGSRNQALFAAELAASFPDATRVVLAGGSAGSVGAMLNYWQWVDAFAGARVDLVSDSFALVFEDGPEWRYALHNPQSPPGCASCATDYRTVYDFNSRLSPESRIAVIDSENDWTLDLATGYRYTQGLEALQAYLDPLPNTNYYIANGNAHVLLKFALDSAASDCASTLCEDGELRAHTYHLSEFLTRMQNDDPGWQSVSCLATGSGTECN